MKHWREWIILHMVDPDFQEAKMNSLWTDEKLRDLINDEPHEVVIDNDHLVVLMTPRPEGPSIWVLVPEEE